MIHEYYNHENISCSSAPIPPFKKSIKECLKDFTKKYEWIDDDENIYFHANFYNEIKQNYNAIDVDYKSR